MDRGAFDALTRMLAASPSRRATLGTLLGAAVAAVLPAPAVAAKRKRKDRGSRRGKARERRVHAEAACCSSNTCTPGPGKNLGKCCYQNQDLTGKTFKGANLGSANFSGATLTGANLQGANAGKACFVDAILTWIKMNGSTNMAGAILCRTLTNSGEDNSGCNRGTPCCPTCDAANPCDDGEVCCEGRCQAIACCGTGGRSTCAAGQVCCGDTCVDGNCCGSGVRGTCNAGQTCCDNTCETGDCCNAAQCRGGQVCLAHRCAPCTEHGQCGSAERCCAGQCRPGNCCSAADCGGGQVCLNNTCAPCTGNGQCGSDQRCCAGRCVTGVCCEAAECRPRGNLCVSAGGGPTSCICGSSGGLCSEIQTCCPAEAGPTNAGACFDLQTSPAHCGRCGNACGPNFVCVGGQCVCPSAGFKLCGTECIPVGQCCVDGDCPVCRRCVSGACQSVPDRTVDCHRTPLEQVGSLICTPLFAFETGICVGGACNCGDGIYDATANICRCGAGDVAECASEDCEVCEVNSVCVDAGGRVSVLGTTCSECNNA